MPAIRLAALTALVLELLAGPAAAASCAEQPVSARGDPSRFQVVARATARGNWRAKVRAMPTLGALYADFNRAQQTLYRCNETDGQHVCIAEGHPCRD